MREIKFRVWDKKKNEWLNVIEFANEFENLHKAAEIVILDNGELLAIDCCGNYSAVDKKERFEINFYTGVKDRNGQEIYEGDILLTPGLARQRLVVEIDDIFNGDAKFRSICQPEKVSQCHK